MMLKEVVFAQHYKICTLVVMKYGWGHSEMNVVDKKLLDILNAYWYCGYVRIPKHHKLFKLVNISGRMSFKMRKQGKKYYIWQYDKIPVDCHGGLTYYSKNVKNGKFHSITIGWDYNHYQDKSHTIDPAAILAECKDVADQLFRRIGK